jgi:hypothetical protein
MQSNKETIFFNGVFYVRYPNAKGRHQRVYFWPQDKTGKRLYGIGALHRAIWENAHGPIPKGYMVHHIDHNPLNNALENLECVSRAEHAKRHAGHCSDRMRENLDNIRDRTKAWHASPAGIAWHQAHGKQTWVGREQAQKICGVCGETYGAYFDRSRFCSRKCIEKNHRDVGTYKEPRTCAVCGAMFQCEKYRASKVCSKKCAGATRRTGRVSKTCPVCGAVFEFRAGLDRKTCSKSCARRMPRRDSPPS